MPFDKNDKPRFSVNYAYDQSKGRNTLRSRTSIFSEHVNKENKKKFEKQQANKVVTISEKEEVEKKKQKK